MALVVKDRVKETTTTQGTGTVTLAGASSGYQSFAAIGDGNTTYYTIAGGNEWEVGIGTYTASGTTLSRDTVFASSNSNALVSFSAGSKDVFVTYPAEQSIFGLGQQSISTNNTTITSSSTFPSSYNGLSVGPITIQSGASVTVPSGQRWVVI